MHVLPVADQWHASPVLCYDHYRTVAPADTLRQCQMYAQLQGFTHVDFYPEGCIGCGQHGYKCYMTKADDARCLWGAHETWQNVVSSARRGAHSEGSTSELPSTLA